MSVKQDNQTTEILKAAIADTKAQLENAPNNQRQGLQDQLQDYKEDLRVHLEQAKMRLTTEYIPAEAAAAGRSRLGAAAGRRRSRRRRRGRKRRTRRRRRTRGRRRRRRHRSRRRRRR